MDKWEYKIVLATGTTGDEKTLNDLGEHGFEVIGIGQRDLGAQTPELSFYVLKRRKPREASTHAR